MDLQSVIVVLVVLACAASVLRSVFRQFSASGQGGCGGCGGAAACGQKQDAACTAGQGAAQSAPIQWHPRRGGDRV